jgi:hypothetical protein
MAFKIGNKIAISDNSVFNVTDTSDSDGGVVDGREGNLNLDLSTGSIFEIPNPGTNKARLKEKLSMSGWPDPGESKTVTLLFNGRGAVRTSPTFSSLGSATTWGPQGSDWHTNFTFSHDGTKLFYYNNAGGRNYVRRLSLKDAFDLDSDGTNYNNDYDQSVRFDTGFISIPIYTYPSNNGAMEFNNDGTKIYFAYNGGSGNYVYEFSLSSAYDLNSTRTLENTITVSDYSSDTSPDIEAIQFYADGHVLVGVDTSASPSNQILAFYLSTAYDTSTIYDSKFVTPTTGNSNFARAIINHNGDKIWLWAIGDRAFFEHTLSTPFDVSTISGSYSTYNPNYTGNPIADAIIRHAEFTPDTSGNPDGFIFMGDQDADLIARYSPTISTATRSNLLWDSDKISMLNDSASPRTDSGETDLFEFLVFDSATGAKQSGFINNV